MLRTLIVLALVAYGIRHSVRGAFYALLFYLWVAYFRPEQWVWGGVVQTLPLSFLIGVVAILAALLSLQLTISARILLIGAMVVHSLLSTLLSDYTEFAWPYWTDFAKSAGITWLIASLATDVKRLRLVMLVMSLSIGFEAAKQGWVQLLLSPGTKNYNDIPFIGDNNAVAVAMYVLVAFLVALGRTSPTARERWLHRLLAAGTLYRGIVTYSRGGFLSGAAMGMLYLIRSKRKLAAIATMALLLVMIVPVLPEAFWDRMSTLKTIVSDRDTRSLEESEVDSSFESRRHFWNVAVVMAGDRPFLGVGHNAFTQAYDRYDFSLGRYGAGRSVHSTWFGTLAELGYPGLCLLLLNMGLGWLACRRVRRLKGDGADVVQLREFATAIEVGLVTIAVGGSFVIFQYTELLWHVLGLSIALERVAAQVPVAVPRPNQPAVAAFTPVALPVARGL